jgi:hypothetical protein
LGRPKKAHFGPLGAAGRAVLEWLRELDPGALGDNYPLAHELGILADGLATVRADLAGEGLSVMDRTRLRSQEARLSEAFRKAWVSLGLAIDTTPRPPAQLGRPPEGEPRL